LKRTEVKFFEMKQIVFFWVLVVILTSCAKEQPELTPVNEDCDCASEVSADFEILELESLPQFDPEGTDSDTILLDKNVLFRATEEGAEYTWYIGAEVLNTREVGRSFPSAFANQDITVSLEVRKQPNLICYPQDDGYDSITRTFHVQNYDYGALTTEYDGGVTLMEGTFRVFGQGLADSIDISIDYIDRTPPPMPVEQIDIVNFDGLGTMISIPRNSPQLRTYRGLWVDMDFTSLKCLQGKFLYTLSGEAVFQYSYCEQVNGEWVTIQRDLRGRKL